MRKILAVALVIAVITGMIWVMKPWEILQKAGEEGGETGGENQAPEGKTFFQYQAMFSYEGSEHGEPLDNVIIWFPAPNIEGNISSDQLSRVGWKLEYVDSENFVHTEMTYDRINDNLNIYQMMGERTTPLEVLQGPYLGTESQHRPTFQYQLSELYPSEHFLTRHWVKIDSEDANALTLKRAGENQRPDALYFWPKGYAENMAIDIYFDIQLEQQIGKNQFQIVERFCRYFENGYPSWYCLHPI